METLQQIWRKLADEGYETDKGSVHSYISVYEEILSPYRDTAKNILEIGLFNGHSLRMWNEYFTKADVHGIDCSDQPHGGMADLRPMIEEGWNIHILDAENADKVKEVFGGMEFDVIIDDAGHHKEQQEVLYSVFKSYLKRDGIYIIEDIQDIDYNKRDFETIDRNKSVEIVDRRHINGRFDDVLVIIKDIV